MEYFNGYAFTENEAAVRAERVARYNEIERLSCCVNIKKTPAFNNVKFEGVINGEARTLNELDLAMLASNGTLHFGGTCQIDGQHFSGSYNID